MPSTQRRRRRRRTRRVTAIATCLCACLFAALFEKPAQDPREAGRIRTLPAGSSYSSDLPNATSVAFKGGSLKQVIYPYSVIPGGIQDGADLARKMTGDLVVADHYSDFRTANALAVTVQDAKLVHVSYRVGNKIFWTARKVRLAKGETLITDGKNFARARCGNRISTVERQPTSSEEPPPALLDTAIVTAGPESVELGGKPLGTLPQLAERAPLGFTPFGTTPLGTTFAVPPGGLGHSEGGIPPGAANPGQDIPVVVPLPPPPPGIPVGTVAEEAPEPGTLVLMASGFGVLALLKVGRKKSQK